MRTSHSDFYTGPPLTDGPRFSAVEALRHIELGSAVRARGVGVKNVERLAALSAPPEFAKRRSSFAGGTRETRTARNFGEARQGHRLFQTAPAVDEDESGHDA